MEHAIRRILSRAIAADGVLELVGPESPGRREISILSEQFLAELAAMQRSHLARAPIEVAACNARSCRQELKRVPVEVAWSGNFGA